MRFPLLSSRSGVRDASPRRQRAADGEHDACARRGRAPPGGEIRRRALRLDRRAAREWCNTFFNIEIRREAAASARSDKYLARIQVHSQPQRRRMPK